jgi:hypothetical protein
MRTLWYCGLEPYKGRYTLQLQNWNEEVFRKRNINYQIVNGETLDTDKAIVTGQVLDAHGRTYYSLTQMAKLVKLMKEGSITNEDVIYFEDMFTAGIESLPYILDQVPDTLRPDVYIRCLAQSIDPDDFVHVWNMEKWMASYERMVNEFATGILATNEEMVAHMRIAGWTAPIYNISGLAFGKSEVISRVEKVKKFHDRKNRVVFSARWDQEKQPNFYMDLIELWIKKNGKNSIEFSVCSGGTLKSNNKQHLDRAYEMQEQGKLRIFDNLEKNEYYEILNDSKVVFNCALQDWVSNTVSEADALGCNVLYPAYRSFPETFANDHERMYVPWSLTDAMEKLEMLLKKPHSNMGKISNYNDQTIDRICDILEGKGNHMLRMTTNYRKHVSENKY